jgi:uncharacterized oxidoreductase
MDLNKSTILITGGSNGIGLEFAKQLMQLGAKVIITGRDPEKLQKARRQFPGISIIRSDLNEIKEIEALYERVTNGVALVNAPKS